MSDAATVPFEQELELYHYAESLCSQKARVGMAEKQLAYRSKHIVICDVAAECQNLDDAYLAVNPKGIVPTLVHRGKPVYDAHRIIRYADQQYPDSGARLWPINEDEVRIAEFWFDEGMLKDDQPLGSNRGTSVALLTLPLLARMLSRQPLELVVEKYQRHPMESRRKAFVGLRKGGGALPPKVMETGARTLVSGLKTLDAQLGSSPGPWALSEFSVVDITMMACFHRLQDLRLDGILQHQALPNLSGYWASLRKRPSYQSAILDWHDEVNWRSAVRELDGAADNPFLEPILRRLDGG